MGAATIPPRLLRRNPDAVKKGLFDFVAILKIPREDKEPEFDHLPEVDNFCEIGKGAAVP